MRDIDELTGDPRTPRSEALYDGHLNEQAVGVPCPVCTAPAGTRCTVDDTARPYPSTMRVGLGARFHIARSVTADERETA